MNHTTFRKLNHRPLKISFTTPLKKEPRAYFRFKGHSIYLDTVIRKDSPWAGKTDLPDFIHGVYDNYPCRTYVQITSDTEYANLYERI